MPRKDKLSCADALGLLAKRYLYSIDLLRILVTTTRDTSSKCLLKRTFRVCGMHAIVLQERCCLHSEGGNPAWCWVRQNSQGEQAPMRIIHPPPRVEICNCFQQKLVIKILSYIVDAGFIPTRKPIRGRCGDGMSRCDPIAAIGSPPPMTSFPSPLKFKIVNSPHEDKTRPPLKTFCLYQKLNRFTTLPHPP